MEKEKNLSLIDISKEMESSFIDYAMSVIVSRAIPDVRDGLKPVHRRILYAMSDLEMHYNKSFKKSAKVVGEVIAKYHPHGDAAVYDAMVRLAQTFSLRYPLILGQGNFGSIDGDSAAAMRYTEAKLQKISGLLLRDLKKDTVKFQENYDGSEKEPKTLPSLIPNLLINGSTGIAVGMATSIPPHNIVEVLNAAKALSKNSLLTIIDLMKYVKAPDFPTKGIIVNKSEIFSAYNSGRGRVIVRARTNIEFDEKGNYGKIIITEIPYMVNKSNLILKIADLVRAKVINSISDIRDESNRKGIRVVIKLKRGYIPVVELNKLFKLTQLQSSFPINMLALVDDRPVVLDLKKVIEIYIDYQILILIRKTKYLFEKAKSKKHILEGLNIALGSIDEIISLIKLSSDNKEAISKLMKNFSLSELQSKAILDMKLQRLTGLERKSLQKEIEELEKNIKEYERILDSKEAQIEEINIIFDKIISEFGDDRLTEISDDIVGNIEDEDLIPQEEVVVTLTNNGYIKRLPVNQYKVQNRGGQGFKGITTNEDDYVQNILITNTHTDLMFFTSLGKVYKLRAHQIPQFGKTAKGFPIVNLIKTAKNEVVKSLISVSSYKDFDILFVTKKGIVKKTNATNFKKVNKNGKIAISLKEKDELLGVLQIPSNEESYILLGNSNGKAIKFKASDVRAMGRTASGVKGMNIDRGIIIDYASSVYGKLVLSISRKGFGKLTNLDDYRLIKRGGKGIMTINTKLAGALVSLKVVNGEEDLMIMTNNGTIIRTSLEQVKKKGRNTKGVKLIDIKEKENISSVEVITSNKLIDKEIKKQSDEIKLSQDQNSEKVYEQEKALVEEIESLTAEFNVDVEEKD